MTSVMVLIMFCYVTLHRSSVSGNNASHTCAYVDFIGKNFHIDEVTCRENAFCMRKNRTFKISYIELPPYFHHDMPDEEVGSGDRSNIFLRSI